MTRAKTLTSRAPQPRRSAAERPQQRGKPAKSAKSFVEVLARTTGHRTGKGELHTPAPTDRRSEWPSEALAAEREPDRGRHGRDAEQPALPVYLQMQTRHVAALHPPVGATAPSPEAPAFAHAQAAMLAQRMLHSVRVGRVAGGHEVRLRLQGSDVEVQLQEVGGVIRPTLVGEGDLSRLAARLDEELTRCGARFDRVEFG